MRGLFAVLFAVSVLASAPAEAATTVFASGVASQSGTVASAGSALGPLDGATATIGGVFTFGPFTFGFPGQVVYTFSQALSGAGLQLTALAGVGAPTVAVSIGEIVGGVAVFSTETAFVGGAGTFALNLQGQCAAISASGCSLLRIRTIGGFGGGTFRLDGVSGVSAAPEPQMWAMMLIAFGAVAWRLKQQRLTAQAIRP